jgi:hypothetical protein
MIVILLLLAGLLLGGTSSSSSSSGAETASAGRGGGGVTSVEVPSGWDPAVRSALDLEPLVPAGCRRRDRQSDLALQREASGEAIDTARRALGPASGDVWFDSCDQGRLKVGVAPASLDELRPRLARVRAELERAGVTDRTDFVAVDCSSRELRAALGILNGRLDSLLRRALISTGLESDKNGVVVDAWRKMPARDRKALMAAVRAAGVHVVVRWRRTQPVAMLRADG